MNVPWDLAIHSPKVVFGKTKGGHVSESLWLKAADFIPEVGVQEVVFHLKAAQLELQQPARQDVQ